MVNNNLIVVSLCLTSEAVKELQNLLVVGDSIHSVIQCDVTSDKISTKFQIKIKSLSNIFFTKKQKRPLDITLVNNSLQRTKCFLKK